MAKHAPKLAKKARKAKISVVKMANIQRNKMAKQGIFTKMNRKKFKKAKKEEKRKTFHQMKEQKKRDAERIKEALLHLHPLSAELKAEDFVEMLDEDELQDIIKRAKPKRSKTQKREDQEQDEGEEGEKEERDSDEEREERMEEEADYEIEGRSFGEEKNDKKRQLLPIIKDGEVIMQEEDIEDEEEPAADSGVEADAQPSGDGEQDADSDDDIEKVEPLPVKSTVDLLVERQNMLQDYKIRIGCWASNIVQDPNNSLGHLKQLNLLLDEPPIEIAFTIQKYTALSLLEIFHNLIPNYFIETHEMNKKIKKDLRALYIYENELVHQYKNYLLNLESVLEKFKKNFKNESLQQVANICLRCLGELLTKHSHFNFTNNIIQLLVPYLNSNADQLRKTAVQYITQMFKEDPKGDLSLEAVEKIDKYVRKSRFRVKKECLSVLLSIKANHLQNIDVSRDIIVKSANQKTRNERMIAKMAEKMKSKPSRQQAKDKKKMAKLNKEINVVLESQDKATKSKRDTEVVEIIFGLYIHVIKRKPNKKLIGTVLEGLAKFAHLINVEFFSDLLEVLAELMEGGPDLGFTLTHQESLYCIQTVLTILSGQGEALNIDPHRFTMYLYEKLFEITAAKQHENIITAIKSAYQLLIQRKKSVSPAIINAFTKRLCTITLGLLHHGAMPTLAMVRTLFITHNCTEALLDTDPEGTSGMYCPEARDPTHSNSEASSLWELHLLSRHYHPNVQQVAKHLLVGAPIQGPGSIPFTLTKLSTEEMYEMFDPSEMKLKPSIPHPNNLGSKKRKRR